MDATCTQQVTPCPRTNWAPTLPVSRPIQASGHARFDPQLCQELPPTPTLPQWSDPNSGYLGPVARLQGMALPASHLALTPEPGFTHQWVGNSPGVLWTLAMPTSEPALAPGPMGLCSQLPWDQVPLMNHWQPPHRVGPSNQACDTAYRAHPQQQREHPLEQGSPTSRI